VTTQYPVTNPSNIRCHAANNVHFSMLVHADSTNIAQIEYQKSAGKGGLETAAFTITTFFDLITTQTLNWRSSI
jgi:hypothetical protein